MNLIHPIFSEPQLTLCPRAVPPPLPHRTRTSPFAGKFVLPCKNRNIKLEMSSIIYRRIYLKFSWILLPLDLVFKHVCLVIVIFIFIIFVTTQLRMVWHVERGQQVQGIPFPLRNYYMIKGVCTCKLLFDMLQIWCNLCPTFSPLISINIGNGFFPRIFRRKKAREPHLNNMKLENS